MSAHDARVLILGSMPGRASLEANEYYAHPRNAFWPVVEAVLGISRTLPYAARLRGLVKQRVALWDVLRTCTRVTSLDSDIVESSIVPNDFIGFFARHPQITQVFFNGLGSQKIFMRHVHRDISVRHPGIVYTRLPSTSPANARYSLRDKVESWRVLRPKHRGLETAPAGSVHRHG